MRRNCFVTICLFVLSGLFAASLSAQAGPDPRRPKGIYTNFLLDAAVNRAETAAYPGSSPGYPNPAADAILVKYFTTLLDNPAISGLAPQIPWDLLNPNDPGQDPFHPAADAYIWNPLDDVFIAVDRWNSIHRALPPKTIQLIVSPGYNSPGWIFSEIDASVCGRDKDCSGAGSCDALFMSSPAVLASPACGYTTLFFQVESGTPTQEPFPLPWNSVYKNDWRTFLVALNQRVQREPSSYAFNTMTVAGPTASSTEMILPNVASQKPDACEVDSPSGTKDWYLSLMETLTVDPKTGNQVPVCTLPEFDVPTAWNTLFRNHYGPDQKYQNTDLPFIEEWDAVIDEYSQIFNGVTLALTTTTDALPTFPNADSSLLIPAQGFESDCGNDPQTNPVDYDPSDAMACAAVTLVLTHYTNPLVGGNNAKLTFEAGMTAARDSIDLGTNGIKWLAATTSSGLAPIRGTPFRMSRILGGVQFSRTFSKHSDIQSEGCPDYTLVDNNACPGLTPGEGLQNVLSISYFPGTVVGPSFCPITDIGTYGCASTSVDDGGGVEGNFVYRNAPMNFLQIYDDDVIYASGLSGCTMAEITGNPVNNVPPTCVASPTTDVATTQGELNLASQKLLSIAEPTELWWPSITRDW